MHKSTVRPALVLVATLAVTALAGAPPAAADCHEDPVTLVECALNDAEAGSHSAANAVAGQPVAELEAATLCGDRLVAWDDWTTADDEACAAYCSDSCVHWFAGTHRLEAGQAGLTGPLPLWLERGELWVDAELVDECRDDGAPGEWSHSCETEVVVEGGAHGCLLVDAVTILASGYEHRVRRAGPWTPC